MAVVSQARALAVDPSFSLGDRAELECPFSCGKGDMLLTWLRELALAV